LAARLPREQELGEPDGLLRALFHASPLPIIVFTPDGNITLWNAASERVFGWRADEVLGGPPPFVPEDKLEEQRSLRDGELRGEAFPDRELRRRRKDGSSIYIQVSTEPLRDSLGAVTAIMSVYVDVTEQRRHGQRLLAQYNVARILSEAHSLDEAAPVLAQTLCENLGWQAGLVWTRRTDDQELRCAALWQEPSEHAGDFEAACRNRTFAPDVGLPGRIWARQQPAWITDLRYDPNFPRLTAAANRGLRAAFGFPILLAGNVFGVMEFFSGEILDPDQDLLHMVSGIGYQIGEFLHRQRAQKNLAEREESFRTLTETASDGIISIDATSTILFANTASGKIFGYTREELIGTDLTILMPDYLRRMHRAAVSRYLETGKRHISWEAVQLPGRHRDGHEIPLEISFAEYQQDRKHVFIGIVRDITERKRLDEKLRQTAKLESLGLLAGGIAHDFNNILTGIMGNISLASEMLSESHPAFPSLREAAEASEQASHLTKQLLAYAGKGRFVIQPLDLSELVRETSALVKASIPKNVQLRLDLLDPLPCIEGDSTQLQQLIMNLAINAGEAIGAGDGTVLITTNAQDVDEDYITQLLGAGEIAPGKYVSLEVHDTGCGMDDATRAQIFDPFFTTKFTGRGLGLAAALGIVRGHKGALKVYSAPGKGSTFKVLFPASDVEIPKRAVASGRDALQGGKTVLVVDDEEVVRRVVKSMLERHGYKALLAEDGLQAVEILEQMRDEIALIILDLTMPVMNGEEALRRLKLINPDVPILLSSGYNEMEAIQRFAGKGLAGFIQKPYTSARLAEKLRSLLARNTDAEP